MDETIDYIQWAHHRDPEPFGKVPSPNDFRIQPAGEKRLAILFPALNEQSCSGGPNTILRFAAEVASKGIRVICLSLQMPAFPPAEFQAHLVQELGIAPNAASRMEVHEPGCAPWLNRGDKIMATASWTFPLARGLAQRCGLSEPAYFIQDLEPLFLGLGLSQAWLMETYYERFLPIINSTTLAQALFNIGNGSFATQSFRDSALVFTPSVDRALFHPEAQAPGKKIIFLYARLNEQESRNMPELAIEAVNRMCWDGILDDEEWEIHCYGSPDARPFRMRNGMIARMLPHLTLEEYAAELRSAAFGMAFVLSPHPGYMAFELAACGVPVITNIFLNKTAAYMRSISPLIHASHPTYDAVTATLRRCLQEKAYRMPGKPLEQIPINLPPTWRDSFSPVISRFMDWFERE